MKKTLAIAARDLLETLRDPLSFVFLVAMPVAFTLFYGLVANTAESSALPQVLWLNQDQRGAVTQAYEQAIVDTGKVELVTEELDVEQATDLVRRGKHQAALIIPAGWGERALAGQEAGPQLVVDEASAEGQELAATLQTAGGRVQSALAIVRTVLSLQEQRGGRLLPGERETSIADTLAAAAEAYGQPTIEVDMEAAGGAELKAPAGYQQSSPGGLVQFAIFGLIGPASLIVGERKQGTLQRLLSTATNRAQIAAGHMLAIMATVLLSQLLMVAVGQLFLGVAYLQAPLATLLIVLALSFFSASLGMLLAAVSRSEEQLTTWTIILGLLMSALGGAWFSLEMTGATFARIGHLFPTAWAMDGLQNVVVRSLGLGAALAPAGVLLAYGAVLLLVATRWLRAR